MLGTSTDNLFSVQNTENNILESVQCNPSYGIMFNDNRLNSKRDGKWGMIPSIVCSGYVKYKNGIIYTKSNSWDGRVIGFEKLGAGYYRIILPEVWINAGVNPANCYVMLTGIGWSRNTGEPSDRTSPIKATLWKWDAKIDSLYVELRQEQAEKLNLIHKNHGLELKNTELTYKKCDVRGCANRKPPSDY